MPTTSVSLRIDNDLLKLIKQQAEAEHRTLSNMIVSLLDNSFHASHSYYPPEDIEKWFTEAGVFLSTHTDEDTKHIYWNFVKAREACYSIIYPELFQHE